MPALSCGCSRLLVKVKLPRRAANVRKAVEKKLPTLTKVLVKFFNELSVRIVEELTISLSKRSAADILAEIKLEGFTLLLSDELTPELMVAFKEAGLSAMSLVGGEVSTDSINTRAAEYATKRAGTLADIEDTTRELLRSDVTQALEEGWSAQELAAAVKENFAFSETRAETIARTELALAHVQGNLAGWLESGVVIGKRSILADTHPQEDECDEAAAEGVIDIGDTFSDGSDGPPYHPNCLCDLEPILATDSTA